MKFAFVIAALFAASAIAAPCARRHVDDVADVSPMDDSNGVSDNTDASMPMDDNNNDTPMDDNTPSMDDNTPTTDDSLAISSSPSPSAGFESLPDAKDEVKTSAPDGGKSDNSQTAVINNDSPDKGGKGSLFGLDTSSLLAGGVFETTGNTVKQQH